MLAKQLTNCGALRGMQSVPACCKHSHRRAWQVVAAARLSLTTVRTPRPP